MAVAYQYKVEGISCVNCVNGIKSHLAKKSIHKIHVDIAKGVATVYSEDYRAEEIEQFINDLGYKAQYFEHAVRQSYKLEYSLLISAVLSLPLLGHMFVSDTHTLQNPWLQICLSTPVLFIGYWYFAAGAINSIQNLRPNMNVLILMGATAAYIYSLSGWILNYNSPQVHHYLFFETAATIITLVLLGNYFEKRSITQTTTALDSLQQLQSKEAIIEVNGELIKCPISELKIGDILLVNQGDSIPIDANIMWGECSIDESWMAKMKKHAIEKKARLLYAGVGLADSNNMMSKPMKGQESLVNYKGLVEINLLNEK